MATPTQGTCTAPYTPAAIGRHTITAVYPGDANHDSSQGTDTVDVTQPGGPGTGQTPGKRPQIRKKCKKKHRRSAEAAKKRCKRKRR
jgi:hypothetical protein